MRNAKCEKVNREMQNVNLEVPKLDADTLRPEPASNDQTLSLAPVCQKRHFRISHFAFPISFIGAGRLNLVFSDVKLRPLN